MNGGVIPHTPIAVDFWKIRECPQTRIFLLTHLHGDHITGLTSSWNYPIYCSEITGKLLEHKHGIKKELIHTMQIGCAEIIYLDLEHSEQMSLTAIDANHCPGAVMFLMEGYFGTILHTGDFRFTPEMIETKPLTDYAGKIDQLFLDNTYCSPACRFPSRDSATDTIINIIESHPSHMIVLGLRNLGKETLLYKIAEQFHEYISVPSHMFETLEILEAPDVFMVGYSECRIRVVPFHKISNKLVASMNEVQPTIVILPTALYCGIDAVPYENQDKVFVVPYSDHSSYNELEPFVSFIRPGKIIPIVKAKSRGPFGISVADRADMSVFGKYTHGGWNVNIDVPRSVKRYMTDVGSRATVNKAGKKRKIGPGNIPVASKRVKRGVIFDSPSHSLSGETLTCKEKQRGVESRNKESANETKRSLFAKKRLPTPPKPQKEQVLPCPRSKETCSQNNKFERCATYRKKAMDVTTGLHLTTETILEYPNTKISAKEKVENWLHTIDCGNPSASAEQVVEKNNRHENELRESLQNESKERGDDQKEKAGVEDSFGKSFEIQESQGFHVSHEMEILIQHLKSDTSGSDKEDVPQELQESNPCESFSSRHSECLEEQGSQGFHIDAKNIWQETGLSDSETGRQENIESRESDTMHNSKNVSQHGLEYETSNYVVKAVLSDTGKDRRFDEILGCRTYNVKTRNRKSKPKENVPRGKPKCQIEENVSIGLKSQNEDKENQKLKSYVQTRMCKVSERALAATEKTDVNTDEESVEQSDTEFEFAENKDTLQSLPDGRCNASSENSDNEKECQDRKSKYFHAPEQHKESLTKNSRKRQISVSKAKTAETNSYKQGKLSKYFQKRNKQVEKAVDKSKVSVHHKKLKPAGAIAYNSDQTSDTEDSEPDCVREDSDTVYVIEDNDTACVIEDNDTSCVKEDSDADCVIEVSDTVCVREDNDTNCVREDNDTKDNDTDFVIEDNDTNCVREDNDTDFVIEDNDTGCVKEDSNTDRVRKDSDTKNNDTDCVGEDNDTDCVRQDNDTDCVRQDNDSKDNDTDCVRQDNDSKDNDTDCVQKDNDTDCVREDNDTDCVREDNDSKDNDIDCVRGDNDTDCIRVIDISELEDSKDKDSDLDCLTEDSETDYVRVFEIAEHENTVQKIETVTHKRSKIENKTSETDVYSPDTELRPSDVRSNAKRKLTETNSCVENRLQASGSCIDIQEAAVPAWKAYVDKLEKAIQKYNGTRIDLSTKWTEHFANDQCQIERNDVESGPNPPLTKFNVKSRQKSSRGYLYAQLKKLGL